MSGARDSQVLLETLDAVAGTLPPTELREPLAAEHAVAVRQLAGEGIPEDVVRELHEMRERIAGWPLEHDPLDSSARFRRV